MKKVLALVLAFVMVAGLATVAMAATTSVVEPGLYGDTLQVYDSENKTMEDATTEDYVPGAKFYIPVVTAKGGDANVCKDTDDLDNHKVTYEVESGKKLIDSVKIVTKKLDNDKIYYFVEIATVDNMNLDEQKLEIKNLKLSATKPAPTAKDSNAFVTGELTFKYDTTTPSTLFALAGEKVEFEDYTEDEWVEVEMFAGDDISFASKMYKQPDLYISFSDDVQEKYEELYGDEAALDYVWFTQPKAFKQAGTLTIPAAMIDGEKAPYLYEEKDGKLVEIKNAYDEDEEAFILKNVKTLGKYVISDIELEVKDSVDGDETEPNPGTGANDVVAIAAGLAVVSLVAAGAVSLKK